MIEDQAGLKGQPLAPDQVFDFHCHPGLACFNACCAHKSLPLLPYDLLRLRRQLSLESAQVLEAYAELELEPGSGWPVLRLRLTREGRCPLVSPQGCSVYPNRPAACRAYPLARAVKPGPDGRPAQEVFLRQETPGCLGWGQGLAQSPRQWVAGQGLDEYLRQSNALLPLFMHPRRSRPLRLSQAQIHGVVLALYNLDQWRLTVGEPAFARRQGLPGWRVAKALARDEDLLLLGRDWLLNQLFGQAWPSEPEGEEP